ncbi:Uncharacterised protein [Mycobacteroides abscessus subsp. abscessus]|nr:Uncharacterised protein [Mycobacteroides abscessus subsp. abscessus]
MVTTARVPTFSTSLPPSTEPTTIATATGISRTPAPSGV